MKWVKLNGLAGKYPQVYVNGKLDKSKTEVLAKIIMKLRWKEAKDASPELLAELLGYNDFKVLNDPDAPVSKQALSFLSLLLTYFPATKAAEIYKAFEAAKMLEAGRDMAVDLAKISKATGLTAKESKALEEMWKSEQVSGKFADEIDNLDPNKINHIMLSKHEWEKVVIPPTWENVKPLVNEVMEKGVAEPYGNIPGVFQKQAKIGDRTVTVTYREMDGKTIVSDAWVNY
ncbi:polymorphic toxin type 35 domain-containing protein [Lactococcus lactis]|uniref:polymorphic toxin type 35 domain-containing protein n=1 Tax=Lactococcus lactis TaxID=1358 RepID=UPI00223AC30A|nr:polymorphic toxin type 35 domain-containing protein [Lactococcus lactis]MCT0449650.1 hypothetical protein [Lactococcus lactis subsp. lactis]